MSGSRKRRQKKLLWSQVSKGTSEFFLTQDLQFNRVLQNRALEQAGRFIAEDLASRFLLFQDSGELDKAVQLDGRNDQRRRFIWGGEIGQELLALARRQFLHRLIDNDATSGEHGDFCRTSQDVLYR